MDDDLPDDDDYYGAAGYVHDDRQHRLPLSLPRLGDEPEYHPSSRFT